MALVRDLIKTSRLCNLSEFSEVSYRGSLQNSFSIISVRTTKHWNPKFKWFRGKKVQPVKLPHTKEAKEKFQQVIKDLKIFPRYWKSRPLTITSANTIFEPYNPPEGDGKSSKVSSLSISNLPSTSKAKYANSKALSKISSYDTDFNKNVFVQEAHDIYVKAHTVLMKKDPEELSKYVTESALQQMIDGIKYQTLRWKFIESLEPPRLVQSRVEQILMHKYLFGQLTVRFHTKQCLAIYDRFGRLMHGSEVLAKDVLEYVIFEKHINNTYGVWRMHGKIIPEWSESTPIPKTYRIEKEVEEEEDDEVFVEEDYPKSEPAVS